MGAKKQRDPNLDLFESIAQERDASGGGGLHQLVKWMPTALALGLFGQVCLAGLRPALEERERLRSVAEGLEERRDALLTEAQDLEQLRAAQNDPVYQERLRRRGLDPQFRPGNQAGL